MRKFGLIGKNISYSFSRSYFEKKFSELGITATYENFDLPDISHFRKVLEENPELEGLNVTIPYKEEIIPFLNSLDTEAAQIGAVNTINFSGGKLKGFNTDHHGFAEAIRPLLEPTDKKALILGTGGASKAVAYALRRLDIIPVFVSRSGNKGGYTYAQLGQEVMKEHSIIINTTPLGTFPNTSTFPTIPTDYLSSKHLLFDLIYNPEKTRLMELAEEKGARTCNGKRMLELQAEKAWEIWNSPKNTL